MTDKEAMKLALEAIEFELSAGSPAEEEYASMLLCDARTALNRSMAEQPAQRDIRNETLDEIATKIQAMPFGDTAASFAVWIREQKT